MAGHVDAPERLDMTRWTIPILATVVACAPSAPDPAQGALSRRQAADPSCIPGNTGEQVCYTGVFPDDPILVDFREAVRLPDTTYTNSTTKPETFTIEWAGVSEPGSGTIHVATLQPGEQQTFTGIDFDVSSFAVGSHTIVIGWNAYGDLAATVQRQFTLVVLQPGQLREVIQVPVRWCAVEGSPQAGGHKAGDTTPATRLLSVMGKVNDDVWLPGASILFRLAPSPQGIPVVADPMSSFEPGDVNLTGFGSGEWGMVAHECDSAWAERYPDQVGTVLVNARTLIPETETTVGGVAPAVPLDLRVTGARGSLLCSQPRDLDVSDVTVLAMAVTYDPALWKAPGSRYYGDTFDPVKVIAHELGHTLTLGHGNGLDDNHDGSLPPTPGLRRFDEYCDPLAGNEDDYTNVGTCEATSSLMRPDACKNLQPLQREMARAAAKLLPGAVVTDPAADPAGRLVATPGTCPPACSIAPSLVLRTLELTETPGTALTSFTHTVVGAFPRTRSNRYVVYADLDDDGQTGCSTSDPGVPAFQGAELRTEVTVAVVGGIPTATPRVWRCSGGSWVEQSDPGIEAGAYVQTMDVHDAPPIRGGGIVTIRIPDSVRGPAGSVVRLQGASLGNGESDLLPASGTGAELSLVPPRLPTCSTSPPLAAPGQPVTIAGTGLPASEAAQVVIGGEAAGIASTDATGQLQGSVSVPSTARQGVRTVEARFQGGTAVCALLVRGGAVTPVTTATPSPAANTSGWNNTPVDVTLAATDASGSGIDRIDYSATGAQPISPTSSAGTQVSIAFSQEGQTVLHYFATSNASVSEPQHELELNLDVTPPTIEWAGNQGVYGILDTVNVTCTAADALSGLLSNTCRNISGPAYLFTSCGSSTFEATAIDLAGNVATASTSFRLRVTFEDLCTLTRTFIATCGTSPHANLGNSFCSQLASAQAAQERGNLRAARNIIEAYVHHVAASRGAVFTEQQVDILTALAREL